MNLTFDETTHTYRLDGLEIPSVTQALKVAGGYEGIPRAVLNAAAERGNAVHLATELFDRGDLDLASLDPVIEPFLEAWTKFLADTGAEVLGIEELVSSKKHRYAGTLDRRLLMDGRQVVGDIKATAKLMPSVGPQTAAYQEAWNTGKNKADKLAGRIVIQLRNDGTYRIEELKERTDFSVFLSCLQLTNWRMHHGNHWNG